MRELCASDSLATYGAIEMCFDWLIELTLYLWGFFMFLSKMPLFSISKYIVRSCCGEEGITEIPLALLLLRKTTEINSADLLSTTSSASLQSVIRSIVKLWRDWIPGNRLLCGSPESRRDKFHSVATRIFSLHLQETSFFSTNCTCLTIIRPQVVKLTTLTTTWKMKLFHDMKISPNFPPWTISEFPLTSRFSRKSGNHTMQKHLKASLFWGAPGG